MKTIQKVFIAVGVATVISLPLFFLKGCGSDWNGGTVSVTLSLTSASGTVMEEPVALPPGVRFMEFRVAAADMAEIVKVVDTGGYGPVSESFDVPQGEARKFTVRALDADRGVVIWNGSAVEDIGTAPVTVTVYMEFVLANDVEPPTIPARVAAISDLPGTLTISWEPSLDNNTVASYRVYEVINGEVFLVNSTTATSVDSTGLPGGEYCMFVTAVDPTGNESEMQLSPACIIVEGPVDLEPPPAPANFVAKAAGSTVIAIEWEPPAGADDVVGYNIYNSTGGAYEYLASTVETSYSDTRLEGGTYCYNATAVDDANNESVAAGPECATVEGAGGGTEPDVEAPTVPQGLIGNATELMTEIVLAWMPSSDNVAVAGYSIYEKQDNVLVYSATSIANAITLERLTPDLYCFAVSASDAVGNESALSAEACVLLGGAAYDPRVPNCPEFLTFEENPGGNYKWHPDSNPPKCYGDLPKPPKTWTEKVPPGQAK